LYQFDFGKCYQSNKNFFQSDNVLPEKKLNNTTILKECGSKEICYENVILLIFVLFFCDAFFILFLQFNEKKLF